MATYDVKDPEAITEENRQILSKMVGREVKILQREILKDRGIIQVHYGGHGLNRTKVGENFMSEWSLTGKTLEELGGVACQLTGKRLEALGLGDIFERKMEIGERNWVREQETGHRLTEPSEKDRFEELNVTLAKEVGGKPIAYEDINKELLRRETAGEITTKRSETSTVGVETVPLSNEEMPDAGLSEGNKGSDKKGTRRGRGRPRKGDGEGGAT